MGVKGDNTWGLLLTSPACKKLGCCRSIVILRKKLNRVNNKHLFLEVRSQSKMLPTKLEKQEGKYKESQLTKTETLEQKPLMEPILWQENLNCN